MSKYQTYMGHETWWNSLRMNMKMYKNIFTILLVLDVLLVGYLLTENQASLFTVKEIIGQSIAATGQWFNNEISRDGYFHYLYTLLRHGTSELRLPLAVFCCFLVLGFPVATGIFRKRAKNYGDRKFVRGARLKSINEINRSIKRRKEVTRFRLGGVRFTEQGEVYHTAVIGSTGCGKTSGYFAPLIAHLMARGEKGIIHCSKADFTSRFFEYENACGINLLFNTLDKRSIKWTVFNDIRDVTDIDRVAHMMIRMQPHRRDPSWDNGARDILTGLLHYAYENDRTSNADLWEIFTSPIRSKLEMLGSTEKGAQGRDHLLDPDSKQAHGYNSVFMLHISAFRYMEDGEFCIRKWLEEETPGFIFATNNTSYEDTVRPALSLFIDVLASHVLTMEDRPDRRIFFLLDEFTSLNSMPSLVKILRLGRSKGAAVSVGVQDFGQIQKIYGREDRQTILGNINNIVAMRTRDVETAKHLSHLLGDTVYLEPEISFSGGVSDIKDGVSVIRRKRKEPLVLPSEIQNLKDHEAYIILANHGQTQTTIEADRLYVKESGDGIRKVEPFALKKGLSLEEIKVDHRETRKGAFSKLEAARVPERSRKRKNERENT